MASSRRGGPAGLVIGRVPAICCTCSNVPPFDRSRRLADGSRGVGRRRRTCGPGPRSTPAVGRTSGSTQGPVAAPPVPDRLEASVRGPAPSSAADIAEALSNEGWLTVLDDPLLAREHWVRVAGANGRGTVGPLRDGGRSSYGCYLRVDDPGPCAGPWADIARLEMSSGIGCDAAVEAAARAAGCRASRPLCTGTRGAPVNLTPIAGLERHLHRLQGDVRLALRAGARGGARTQPRGTDGMIDDEGTGSRSSM